MDAKARNAAALGGLLAVSLALLAAHAGVYRFLTDDAFISFRYARNLAAGHGLVFNPGLERVEGYTNFLWVLVLAALDRLGATPERAANVLSLGLTAVLWALVARASRRAAPAGEAAWVTALPCLLLAATRSVAVWSTGGLETRLFEVLVVAGVLRLAVEVESESRGPSARRPWSGVGLGLAALARPDAILIAGTSLAAAAGILAARRRFEVRAWAARAGAFAALVLGHFAFRRAYYGAWLPNTYYAKVGGRTWWDMGLAYAGAFALEYGAILWIPPLVLAVARHRRRGTLHVPALVGAAVVPHLAYVIAIGGDHFEYRPLDLYFPFVFLLVADGVREAVERFRRPALAGAYAAILAAALVWIPWRAHVEYPADRYRAVFPGGAFDDGEAERYLDPARDPVLGLPGLRAFAEAHRALLRRATSALVGIRQEEHRLFLESLEPDAARLRALVAAGTIPRDFHVALSSVGLVPYASDLPTLDRLGLTDAWVARAPSISTDRAMGHEKRDTFEYARSRGVWLSAIQAGRLTYALDDPALLPAIASSARGGRAAAFAEVAPGVVLAGTLPQGLEATRRHFPSLDFRDTADPAALARLASRVASALGTASRRDGDDRSVALGQALLLAGDPASARGVLERAAAAAPDRISVWRSLAGARAATGDLPGAREAIARGLDLARRRGASTWAADLEGAAARLGQSAESRR